MCHINRTDYHSDILHFDISVSLMRHQISPEGFFLIFFLNDSFKAVILIELLLPGKASNFHFSNHTPTHLTLLQIRLSFLRATLLV